MSRHRNEDADWDDEEWAEDDVDDATMPCPYCRRQIHEDSARCPYCERYLSEEDSPPGRRPWWIVVGVLLGLIVVGLWLMSGN